MPNGSLSLAEYPAAMVRLKCWKCDRSGQYRKAALIEKYGANVSLPDLLLRIGATCVEPSYRTVIGILRGRLESFSGESVKVFEGHQMP